MKMKQSGVSANFIKRLINNNEAKNVDYILVFLA
jgi:hypothetical protein